MHHNAISSIFFEPVLLHTVGVVGGLLLQSRVQIWGDFRVPAGSKSDLKHCTAWIAATSHPWLRQQWHMLQGTDDAQLQEHKVALHGFWSAGWRYHIASTSADGRCLKISVPDEVFAGAEIPSTDHHHHEQEGPLREGTHVYIIIFSSTQRLEFQYMSLSSAMRGVDDAPQLKTLGFRTSCLAVRRATYCMAYWIVPRPPKQRCWTSSLTNK